MQRSWKVPHLCKTAGERGEMLTLKGERKNTLELGISRAVSIAIAEEQTIAAELDKPDPANTIH